jgi:TolB protein
VYSLTGDGNLVSPLPLPESLGNVAWPDVSPDGTRIAFVPIQGSSLLSNGIFVASVDGGNLAQLTEGDGTHPRWSPDGSLIAYTCNDGTDVCVMAADGGDQTNLTADSTAADLYPSWTPDGRIVFMSSRDLSTRGRFSDIYVMDVGGTNVTRLTTDESAFNGYPSISPDGLSIVYESDRDLETGSDIYMMDIDGQNNRRITNDSVWNQNPVWSPDGAHILYAAFDDGGNLDLYQISIDGTSTIRLTSHYGEDGGLRFGHAWLRTPIAMGNAEQERGNAARARPPRGSSALSNMVLFATNSFNCEDCLETGLYLVGFDGSNLTRLPVEGQFPAWEGGFDRFAYIRNGELWIANADGSEETQITHAYASLSAPVWDAESVTIAADCMPYGQHDVCLIDPETGLVHNLTPEIVYGTGIAYPYWLNDTELVLGQTKIDLEAQITGLLSVVGRASPDGTRIAYIRSRQLYVANIDGSNEVQLTRDATTKGFPVWSLASNLIVYEVAPGDGRLYLYAIRADGVNGGYLLTPQAISPGPEERPTSISAWLGYSFGP